MFGCSGTQIYDPEVRDDGSGQPWDNDWASWSSVLPRSRTCASRVKAKVLPLDRRCLSCGWWGEVYRHGQKDMERVGKWWRETARLSAWMGSVNWTLFRDTWRNFLISYQGKRLTLAESGKYKRFQNNWWWWRQWRFFCHIVHTHCWLWEKNSLNQETRV